MEKFILCLLHKIRNLETYFINLFKFIDESFYEKDDNPINYQKFSINNYFVLNCLRRLELIYESQNLA